jgi:glycerol-3-phosphate acyltransferase PlsY
MATLGFILAAYLLGSIPFAVLVSRAFGLADPRSYGSRNPGATNVLRSGNKAAAVLTLLGDGAKGWLAVWLTETFGRAHGVDETGIALAGLAAFLGHLFPIFLRFKGGKGVATAAGVLFGFDWILGLGTLATWLIVAVFFRYSSLAALAAAVFAPFWTVLLFGTDIRGLVVMAMSAGLIWRHRQNIANLLAGKEGRLGKKA